MGLRMQLVNDIKPQCGWCNDEHHGICPLFKVSIKAVNRAMARRCVKRVHSLAKRLK